MHIMKYKVASLSRWLFDVVSAYAVSTRLISSVLDLLLPSALVCSNNFSPCFLLQIFCTLSLSWIDKNLKCLHFLRKG